MAKLLDLDVSIPFVRAVLTSVGEFLALLQRAPTSMILGGTDFASDHWIVTRGGVLSSWTVHLLVDYGRWLATCLEVIRRKCERQLDDALIVTDTRSGRAPRACRR